MQVCNFADTIDALSTDDAYDIALEQLARDIYVSAHCSRPRPGDAEVADILRWLGFRLADVTGDEFLYDLYQEYKEWAAPEAGPDEYMQRDSAVA